MLRYEKKMRGSLKCLRSDCDISLRNDLLETKMAFGFSRQLNVENRKVINMFSTGHILWIAISFVLFIYYFDGEGLLTFGWMTVDGTIFTTLMTIFFVAVNTTELIEDTELTLRSVYFARLSSAVAESLILIVVLISQLPVFPQHMHILRYDMMCMHILIPLLTILSFVYNDSPMPRLRFKDLMKGTWFIFRNLKKR